VSVLPGAEAFEFDGSPDAPAGVLLSHGFTGSPQSMRPWGERLAAAGYPVSCPRLPGHGTRWQDLNGTRWQDWYAELERAFDGLLARVPMVVVMGLSMGGGLALRLAEQRPEVAGLVLVNPSVLTLRKDAAFLPLLSRLVPAVKGVANDIKKPGARELAYDRTPLKAALSLQQLWALIRADLGKVDVPVRIYRSAEDHVVEPENTAAVLSGLSSTDVTEIVLPNSYHVATLDNDAMTIFDGSVEFVRSLAASRTGPA
jgi:carboxylesterase